jgi:hypothetical protein
MDFTPFIGRNAFNVQSDLRKIFPIYSVELITPSTILTMDNLEDRIRIMHDNNNTVMSVRIG